MKIQSLALREFSVFKEVELELSPGINVLLGTNATGKSHTMKALYAPLKTFEQAGTTMPLDLRLHEKLAHVFKPDDGFMGRLVRRRKGQSQGSITIKGTTGAIELTLNTRTGKPPVEVGTATWKSEAPSIFLPTREVLAMYEGFTAAYQDRELPFDETYYDACVALSHRRCAGLARSKPRRSSNLSSRRSAGGLPSVGAAFTSFARTATWKPTSWRRGFARSRALPISS
jgi:hypothetical protein